MTRGSAKMQISGLELLEIICMLLMGNLEVYMCIASKTNNGTTADSTTLALSDKYENISRKKNMCVQNTLLFYF